MAKIKINLLGKKKQPAPFGLDKLFEKMGGGKFDFQQFKPTLLKLTAILIAYYATQEVPNFFYGQKIKEQEAKLQTLNAQAGALQKELASKKEIRKQMEQLTKEEAELKRQLDVISSLSKDRTLPFKIVSTVAELIPNNVWLDRLEYRNSTVSFDGLAWEYGAVNAYLRALSENSYFQALTLRSIQADEVQGKPIPGVPVDIQKLKHFVAEMAIRPAGTN